MTILPTIEERPGLGALLGAGLGQGLQQGIASSSDYLMKLGLEREKAQSSYLQDLYKIKFKEDVKRESKEETTGKKAAGHLQLLDRMETLLPYTGATWYPSSSFGGESFNRAAVERRNEFNSLNAGIMGFLKDLDTRGNLPQGLFNKLAEKLPEASLSERENKGRISAIRQAIQAYSPEYQKFKNKGEAQTSETQKYKSFTKGKLIRFDASNPEHIKRRNEILSKTGGDREKARQVMLKEFSA